MPVIERIPRFDLQRFETLVFAGGGNRCWWQAGVVKQLFLANWQLPPLLVGTSAGAGVAAACLGGTADGPRHALESCVELYARNAAIFEWSGLARFKLRFAHRHTYPAWIASFVNAGNFGTLCQSTTRLRVAVTRPARAFGLAGSIAAGTLAYVVDKHLWNSIHPRLPKLLGLRQEFADLHDCGAAGEAQTLLCAAAAAPPFMPSKLIDPVPAFDGGYTDNAPIHAQSDDEKARTLVLLTRHYPKLPMQFSMGGRSYRQPSMKVPVSTWNCTGRTTVRDAFELGEHDAMSMLRVA